MRPSEAAPTLLGGRVRYAQPAGGFRSGIEPVLLAAAVPAREGERILEGGCGSGAGLLCLAARVPGIGGVGVDVDTVAIAQANDNAIANAFHAIGFIAADIGGIRGMGPFDHAFANPPYHPAASTPAPAPAIARAKIATPGLFAVWIAALTAALRPRGTLSLSVPAWAVPTCLGAMAEAGCGSCCLLPLWPREGRPAKLVLLRGVRGGRGPFRLLPGLTLHGPSGFTPEAEAILRFAHKLEV